MIDAVLKYTDRAAALADLLSHTNLNDIGILDWLQDHIIPNVQVWRNSQDTSVINPDNSITVTHIYLPGYFLLVSLPRVIIALRDNPAIQLVIDRDTNTILKRNISLALLQDIRFSPVFMGSEYPWGNW